MFAQSRLVFGGETGAISRLADRDGHRIGVLASSDTRDAVGIVRYVDALRAGTRVEPEVFLSSAF